MKNLIMLHSETQEATGRNLQPFLEDDSDISYSHFAKACKDYNINCVLAPPTAYIGGGIKAGWSHNGTQWTREENVQANAIQDRFSAPDKKQWTEIYENLLNNRDLLVNSPELERLCKDKFPNRAYFDAHFIDTLLIDGAVSIDEIKGNLVSNNPDLDKEILIFKPRYGSEGNGFYTHPKIGNENLPPAELSSYVVQPFLETKGDIHQLGINQRHDIRVLIVNGAIKYVEARQLKEKYSNKKIFYPKSEFSDVSFPSIESLPQEIIKITHDIDSSLAYDMSPRIYGIDVARGASGRYYVFELNTRLNQKWERQSNNALINGRKNLQKIIIEEIARKLESQ